MLVVLSVLLRLVYTLFLVSAVLAQTAPNGPQAAKQLGEMHDAWGPRASSPNTTLAIVEQSHTGTEFRSRLQETGIPAGSVLTLLAWPVPPRGPAEVLRGVTFNDKGLAVCAGRPGSCGYSSFPDDPIEIPFRPFPGEPVRLAVVSQDGQIRAFARTVPVPLQGEDKGCRVSATLLTPAAELGGGGGAGRAPGGD